MTEAVSLALIAVIAENPVLFAVVIISAMVFMQKPNHVKVFWRK